MAKDDRVPHGVAILPNLRKALAAWFVFAVLLVVYLNTLLPGVGGFGDTPKFQFVGRILGIPHPTGYPGYILLNHLFVRLVPFGSLAWKANLLSAVLGALAGAVLVRLLLGLGASTWPALTGGLLLGLTPSIWSQALIAEVYSLHLACVLVVLLLLVLWRRERRDRHLVLAMLVGAFSLANHMTTLFLVPSGLWLVAGRDRGAALRPRMWLWLAGALALVMTFYSYLFLRTLDPATPYVEIPVHDLHSFWSMVSGSRFHALMFAFTPHELVTVRLPLLARFFWRESSVLLIAAAVGVWRLRDRQLAGALLLFGLLDLLWTLNYKIPDPEVFLLPSLAVVVLFAALGLEALIALPWLRARRWPGVLLVIIPLLFFVQNRERVDQSKNVGAAQRAERVLEAVDHDAIIISPDYSWSEYFWYYLLGEGWGDRRIYVMHHFAVPEVAAYLTQGIPFALPERRLQTPQGLRVYCLTRSQAELLVQAGLAIRPCNEDLLEVTRR